MPTCPNCGNETAAGAVFCDQCGAQLTAPEAATSEAPPAPAGGSVVCPACGAGNVPGEAFCDFCGSPLEAPAPVAAEVADPEPAAEAASPAPAGEGEPVPAAEGKPACPACGAEVLPGEAFCANCGASLAEAAPVVEQVPEEDLVEPAIEGPPEAEELPVPADQQVSEAVETAVPEVVAAPPPPVPAPPEVTACPACGQEVASGDKFCSNCGAVLQAEPEVAPAVAPPPVSAAGPRLVVEASGAEIPLPSAGEILIGREDPVSGIYPDVDLTPHGGEEGGVSRQHARMIVEGATYFVEDLDSTNYTFVNKQKLAPKTRHALKDGDEIRCGRVAVVLRT